MTTIQGTILWWVFLAGSAFGAVAMMFAAALLEAALEHWTEVVKRD